jgi:hypothetical protein
MILDVASSSITGTSATIAWTTSQPATSEVDFGMVGAPASARPAADTSLVTAHRVVLVGLLPGSTYYYTARGTTAAGALSISPQSVLTTAPAGSGPEVVGLTALQATGKTAYLTWATSTGTVAQVEYGPSTNYGLFTLLKVFNAPTQGTLLTGLQPATVYHFRVKAWDAQGALGASADATFNTAPSGLAMLVGDETVQTDHVSLQGGQSAAYQYVANQSGQASVVRLYVDAGSTAPVVRLAVYSDQAGTPGSILSQGSAPGMVPGWISVSVPPLSLLEGNRYWVSVLNPLGAGSLNLRQATSGGSSVASARASLAAFPQPFVAGAATAHSPLSVNIMQVPPAITVLGPNQGSVVSGQTPLAAVVDDDVPLQRLQFFVDGQPVGPVLTSAPYSITWNSVDLNPALPHVITARATDALGRSGTSGLVSVQVDNGPKISNVSVGPGLTATSARITWTTDVPSDSQVEFGPTNTYGLSTPVDTQPSLRHDMQLTGLEPNAVYHFRVRGRDAAGAAAVSIDSLFYTFNGQ